MSTEPPADDDFGLHLSWPEAKDGGSRSAFVPGGVTAVRPVDAPPPTPPVDEVAEVADRRELRELGELRARIDELREDVTGLRRAILEWPELDHVSATLVALQADVTRILARPEADGGQDLEPLRADLAGLRAEVEELTRSLATEHASERTVLAAIAPLIEELSELRNEVTSVKRRIGLRADATTTATLDDATMERLVEAVAERVAALAEDRPAVRARRK